ncbi:MAG: CBS domain-containing protein [Clostridia bacterium]|nr:CBS domain-containing protein [Clostridia bacterium]
MEEQVLNTIFEDKKSNAQRFINAYNTIDQTLRSVYNFKRNMTFSDMIRRTVPLNSVVRKYEDKLVDYARLRNAIIHNSNEDYIIAEPHLSVVQEMEKIAILVAKPPLVIESVAKKNIFTVRHDMPLKKVIELFGTSGFKNLPVFENDRLIGVATPARLIHAIGEALHRGMLTEDYIQNTIIKDILNPNDNEVVYCVRSERLTVQEALDAFYRNRKLMIILISQNGSTVGKLTGLITVADVIDLNKIVEDYE